MSIKVIHILLDFFLRRTEALFHYEIGTKSSLQGLQP